MDMEIRRVAISTGGGDAPGLNAVIRAAVISGLRRGWEMCGIRDGYNGLLEPENYPGGGIVHLPREAVRGITHLGGTILGTTNRGNPLAYPVRKPDGTVELVDRSGEIIEALEQREIDAVIAIGGDGSLSIANTLSEQGLRIVDGTEEILQPGPEVHDEFL